MEFLMTQMLFAGTGDDESGSQVEKITSTNAKNDVEEVETEFEDDKVTHTVYLDVTDKEGNNQTSKVEYSVMGGSDPYVEDIF